MLKNKTIDSDAPEYTEGVCRIKRINYAIDSIKAGDIPSAIKILENAVDCEFVNMAEKFGEALEASDEDFYCLHGVRRSPVRLISLHTTVTTDKNDLHELIDHALQNELEHLAELFREFLRQARRKQVDFEKNYYKQYRESVAKTASEFASSHNISEQRATACIETLVLRKV